MKLDRQLIQACDSLPWHQHDHAYAAILLEGCYVEAGDAGRRRVAAGDVIVHRPFCAHANWFDGRGALIVNVPLTFEVALSQPSGRVADPEVLARDLLADPGAAGAILRSAVPETAAEVDAADRFAAEIHARPEMPLDRLAERADTRPRTLRRQFGKAYGTSPLTYRMHSRARRAWE